MGRSIWEKDQFSNEMTHERNLKNPGEIVLVVEDFNGHVGKRIDGFEGVYGGYKIGKKMFKKEDCLSFAIKRS